MKKLIIALWVLILLTVGFSGLSAQNLFNTAKSEVKEPSDPEATAILNKVRAKYKAFPAMEVNFKLTLVSESEDVQKGRVIIQAEKYFLQIEDQDIICNGNTIWFHLKKQNEVQINNPDSDGGDLSPANLMKIYEQDMVAILIGETKEGAITVNHIEFKPRNADSDFFKYRLSVDKKTNGLTKVIAFGKDATQYVLDFVTITEKEKFKPEYFSFDPSKFPGIHVEDLRVE